MHKCAFKYIVGIMCLLASAAPVRGEEGAGDPLDLLRDTALSFFVPMKGSVTAAEGMAITTGLGEGSGIKRGMRLTILREGTPFLHPITREPVGQAERPVGMAEVTETGPEGSRLRVIGGEARQEDIVRLSSAKVVAMFYQSADVDWNLSEEYYYRLKETGRFELIDTEPGTGDDLQVLKKARDLGAEVAIVLAPGEAEQQTVLRQRLLWVNKPAEFSSVEAALGSDMVRTFRLGEEYFAPKALGSVLAFTLPFTSRLITTGDLDGDGEREVLLSTGSRIVAYQAGSSLVPALGGVELRGSASREHIRLDAFDLDGDGRDEIILTSKEDGLIRSGVYGLRDGAFRAIWEGGVFIRVLDGRLYGQKSAPTGGYRGGVFPVRWSESAPAAALDFDLPEGVNIYDFSSMDTPGGKAVVAFDGNGRIGLYDAKGALLWQSGDSYGDAAMAFNKENPGITQGDARWHVSHRIEARGGRAFAMRKEPVSRKAPGIGHKGAGLMGLSAEGRAIKETVVYEGLPANAYDFSVSDGRLFVLAGSMKPNPLNLLKGRGLFTTRLYVYKLKGF
jgi:hypothetical protein